MVLILFLLFGVEQMVPARLTIVEVSFPSVSYHYGLLDSDSGLQFYP